MRGTPQRVEKCSKMLERKQMFDTVEKPCADRCCVSCPRSPLSPSELRHKVAEMPALDTLPTLHKVKSQECLKTSNLQTANCTASCITASVSGKRKIDKGRKLDQWNRGTLLGRGRVLALGLRLRRCLSSIDTHRVAALSGEHPKEQKCIIIM